MSPPDVVTKEQVKMLQVEVIVTWLIGITLSAMCLVTQLLVLCLLPETRRLDQKILTQLSVARLVNSVVEYLSADVGLTGNNSLVKTALTTLYVQTDAVLVCWMFVYTKNMYDRVVKVFYLQDWSCLKLSLLIWIGTLPVGILYPLFINLTKANHFQHICDAVKFIVLSVNLLFFCKIFYVIAVKHSSNNKNLKGIIKSCIISFVLVCITSLQVALTDIFSFYSTNSAVAVSFCVINSYQVLAISFIFGVISRNTK